MAMIVLANPFAILMYVAYGLLCLVVTLRHRKRGNRPEEALQF